MPRYPTFGQSGTTDKNGPAAPTGGGPAADGAVTATPNNSIGGSAATAAGNTSGGAGVQAQGQGTGYVNLQSILGANSQGADSLAQGLEDKANQQLKSAQPGKGAEEMDKASARGGLDATGQYVNSLQSMPGLQGLLQNQYKGQAYTEGGSALDAFLAGTAGGQQFQQAQKDYQSLSNVLANPQGPSGAPAAPKGPSAPAQQRPVDTTPRGKPLRPMRPNMKQGNADWTP